MKRFLFLLGWVDGSDSACGEKTDIHQQRDLLYQFKLGNEHVFAVQVETDSETVATHVGRSIAFGDNYTEYDTVSMLYEVDEDIREAISLYDDVGIKFVKMKA